MNIFLLDEGMAIFLPKVGRQRNIFLPDGVLDGPELKAGWEGTIFLLDG